MTSRPETAVDEHVNAGSPDSGRFRFYGVLWCTAALLACEAIVFRYLFQYGISNISGIDGAAQHFAGLLYLHEWVAGILRGHAAQYGLWSWRLGLGSDALTTLSFYIADPFNLLIVLFPARMLEYAYEALFFFRVLCAGLAGYAYLRTMRATRFAAIAGAVVYVFSGYLLRLGIRHPYFIDPMVWFPLILIGIEWVLARRRWYLLAGALFIAAVSNFYFFFQIGLIAVVYAVARWVELTPRGERLRRLIPDAFRVAGRYALGVALAAWMLVPLALAVFASSREESQLKLHLFYSAKAYLTYVVALISAKGGMNSFSAGFAVLGFLAAGILVVRRGNVALKIMLGVFAAIALVPSFSLVVNAFSTTGYRFQFTAGLFLGAAVAVVLSDQDPPSRRELTLTGIGLAIFVVLDLLACWKLGYRLVLVGVPLAIGVLSWSLLAWARWAVDSAAAGGEANLIKQRWDPLIVMRVGIVVLLVLGIVANGTAALDRHFSNALKSYWRFGTAYARYHTDPGALVSSLPVVGLQRVDKQKGVIGSDLGEVQDNDPLAQGFYGLDFYYSLMADGVHRYSKTLANRAKRHPFDMAGVDDRAALDTLNAVRYYVAPTKGSAYVPYGFEPRSQLGSQTVYENRYALPVGYVYHSVISSETYAAMSPLDRQQALLQGVVLPGDQAPAVARITPASEAIEVTYTLTPAKGLHWDQAAKRVTTTKKVVSAKLTFLPVRDSELYVEMTGVGLNNTAPQLAVTAKAGGPRKTHWFLAPHRGYYWGDRTLLVNLGYHPQGTSQARVGFSGGADASYTSLKVIAVPMSRFGERVQTLRADGMRDVVVGADSLSGNVTSHGDGVLFLSIPYSKGWTARVDGMPAQIVPANVGFIGIPIGSGTHRVELRYRTPGLLIGVIVSLIALIVAAALAIRTERIRGRARTDGTPTAPTVESQ